MTEPPDGLRDSVHEWLRYAQEDLASAERSIKPPPLVASALFHSQQAAEKALKGYLVALGLPRVPRTHDLGLLAETIQALRGKAPAEEDVDFLGKFGMRVRYPDERKYQMEEAFKALQVANRIVDEVRNAVRVLLGE